MSSIVLSAATRSSLLAAQDTASLMAQTQERLATGKKVNSALDNPINFFTASGLDNRAGDLSNLLDAISNGVQTVQAASTAITSMQKLVDSAKSTANQALSDKSTQTAAAVATPATLTTGTSMRGTASANADGTMDFSTTGDASFTITMGAKSVDVKLNKTSLTGVAKDLTKVTSDEVLTAINNQIGNSGSTTGLSGAVSAALTSDGRLTLTSTATGTGATISVAPDATATKDIGFGVAGVGAGTPASAATYTGTGFSSVASAMGAGGRSTFAVGLGAGSTTVNLTSASTTDGSTAVNYADGNSVAAAINYQISQTPAGTRPAVTATFTGGSIKFTANTAGAGTITVANQTGNATDIGFGNTAGATTGTSVNGAAAAAGAAGAGTTFTAKGTDAAAGAAAVNSNRQSLAQQYNDLLKQIDQLAQDASYNGVNLLNKKDDGSATGNKLHIAFNEKDTSNIELHGQDATSTGLGLTGAALGFQSDDEINARLTQLTTATTTLRSMASTLGSNLTTIQTRQDFTKNLINVLQTGSANLVNADLNEEAANSQALSTRQSLAISSLSLANQAQQGVLQLLR